MLFYKSEDKKLAELRLEVTELTRLVAKETDSKSKSDRQQQLARAKSELARHLQNNPE